MAGAYDSYLIPLNVFKKIATHPQPSFCDKETAISAEK